MMTDAVSLKTIYAFLRLGLVTGLLPKAAVVRWADREIMRTAYPSEEVIELALSEKLTYSQVIHMLNIFQGFPDLDLPVKLLLGRAGQLLEANPSQTERIIMGLRLVNAEEHVPVEVRGQITSLGELYERYRQGLVRQEELTETLAVFLQDYRGYAVELAADS
jgi:hypothetical protein